MKYLIFFLLHPSFCFSQKLTLKEIQRCSALSENVKIIRDNWGVPHIYGKTDADAVFGLLYAQCEDDFKRVELNYIEKLGRMAEVKGEPELYNDLLIRLLIDTAAAISDYNKAEPWLRSLLNAYADGINYYLYKNPQVKPILLTRFHPWYPLLWTDGSIGAISTADITTAELKKFYNGDSSFTGISDPAGYEDAFTGSNGFAIGPAKSKTGKAILYINPHVTFYFRPEVQAVSEEGLNVYGAVTWGQFFIYQGFNEHCGWMHTSSAVDVADLYAEKVVKTSNGTFYEYDKKLLPVGEKKITLHFLKDEAMQTRTLATYFTHHGPVMAKRNGKWISLKSYNRSMVSLIQSWKRTKTNGFKEFKQVMELRANTSNNTVFADDMGNIAYWHGNFVPVRNKSLNWSRPVDGTTSSTEWNGLHKLDDIVHVYNPVSGWIQNCNSTPFTAAGNNSPKKENYPAYMAPDGENFRGINAVNVLSREMLFTIDDVIAAGYDTYLAAFQKLLPALINAFEQNLSKNDTLYQLLLGPIATLKSWDLRCAESSIATTLAIEWGQRLIPQIMRSADEDEYQYVDQVRITNNYAAKASARDLIIPLYEVVRGLKIKFGDWKIPWGAINRFQRISGNADLKYDDAQPDLPVGFAASTWGMLPSYTSQYFPGTKKRYGTGGNSFVCAVEFGTKIKAKSLLAGGESGNPSSKHFTDQAEMYTKGKFKDVLFYKEDVLKHAERQYHPGD